MLGYILIVMLSVVMLCVVAPIEGMQKGKAQYDSTDVIDVVS